MARLIDIDALVAEIEKRRNDYINSLMTEQVHTLSDILDFIDTLEVKEVDDELQGIEKEVAEGFVERINKKRIPISLKGEKKAKFKNEFNTLWQVVDGIQFANVAKYIIERLCLHFAAWGAYNLKGIGQIDKDDKKKMDVEVKEVDLEKEIEKELDENWYGEYINLEKFCESAKHFFELGLKVGGEEKQR